MTFQLADRVWETSATIGTGTYALAGARVGYRAFSAVCSNGDTVEYLATDGTNWEIGVGTWATGNNLARTTVYVSTNANSAVSWTAGNKDIFLDMPAHRLALLSNSTSSTLFSLTALYIGVAAAQAASTAPVQISGSASGATYPNLYLQNSAGGGSSAASLAFGTYSGWTVAPPASILGVDNNFSNDIAFRVKATGSGSGADSEIMRLTNTGLGIGTTTPKSKLHVTSLPVFANNAAAITGGLTAGAFYRTGADPDPVCVVH